MERDTSSAQLPLGSQIPEFSLPGVDGAVYDQGYLLGSLGLVVFSCNHCPYVKGSDQVLIDTVNEASAAGLKTLTINSNDAASYPEDSFEKMKEKAAELRLPFPYLYDESQVVARAFDAACTPEAYLFDRAGRLIYHGAINNSPRDPSAATENHLKRAVIQALDNSAPDPGFVHPIGCSIKWR